MPTASYDEYLREKLKDLSYAGEYLTACYEDSPEAFLVGLRDVVDVHGGVGDLAKLTGLNRENLYKALSENGNPKLGNLAAILNAVGLTFEFTAKPRKEAA
jgi:probable addiction module antidote protein